MKIYFIHIFLGFKRNPKRRKE